MTYDIYSGRMTPGERGRMFHLDRDGVDVPFGCNGVTAISSTRK